MKVIIGLGNPGKKYAKTRHNLGFLVVDYIQKNIDDFTKWQLKKKLKAEISKSSDKKIILVKPQTYMNNSGVATKLLTSNFQLPTSNLIITHDDFDLPLGKFKLVKGLGSAGHKGVQSIIDTLGTNDFWRLRIGIRPQEIGHRHTTSSLSFPRRRESSSLVKAEDYVLKKFGKEEMEIINTTIPEAAEELFQTASIIREN